MSTATQIPVLLLKTKSQPHDVYEDHFLSSSTLKLPGSLSEAYFSPAFIPVLEHKQNVENLSQLGGLLRSSRFRERYGGMIFTSQRAVEAWADTIAQCESSMLEEGKESAMKSTHSDTSSIHTAIDTRTNQPFQTDILLSTPFPLYTVGPATSRALNALISPQTSTTTTEPNPNPHPFTTLNPQILGSHTGNGKALAHYILNHYNTLHLQNWFTWYEAPRLPFIPLLGMGSENYSRRRLESTDPRLSKKPLLFLVGETRRDIIPNTLMRDIPPENPTRIQVDEVEVYRTDLNPVFLGSFHDAVQKLQNRVTDSPTTKAEAVAVAVIVIFSPQGSRETLRTLNLIDEHDQLTTHARTRWTTAPTSTPSINQSTNVAATQYIIATIGPTTRDYLRDTFGFEADVCATSPSPEAVRSGVETFLVERGVLVR